MPVENGQFVDDEPVTLWNQAFEFQLGFFRSFRFSPIQAVRDAMNVRVNRNLRQAESVNANATRNLRSHARQRVQLPHCFRNVVSVIVVNYACDFANSFCFPLVKIYWLD